MFLQFGSEAPNTTDKVAGKQQQSAPTTATAAAESQQSNNDVLLNSKNSENQTHHTTAQESAEPDLFAKLDYNDDWCSIDFDLQEKEQQIARTELKDWQIRSGYAVILPDAESFISEQHHPNNQFVSPYQEMEIGALTELALARHKWAMVAYLQRREGEPKIKDELVHELLVQGALHFALEHVVIKELSAAKSNFQIKRGINNDSLENIITALTYASYGVQNYSLAGLNTYLAVTTEELFKDALNPVTLFDESIASIIASKVEELSNDIERARRAKGIELQPVPLAAKKDFEFHLGMRASKRESQLDYFRSLTEQNQRMLSETDCVRSISAFFAKKGERDKRDSSMGIEIQ